MFRQMAGVGNAAYDANAKALFRLHPVVLAAAMERAWENGRAIDATNPVVGHPTRRSELQAIPNPVLDLVLGTATGTAPRVVAPARVRWEHLIYAHMIENTGVYEIFRNVLHRYLHGHLEAKTVKEESHAWLRATEELFYKNQPPFTITALASDIRPDLRATRRNAYWRMFGMDLIHGEGGNGRPYPYERPQVANVDFRETWRKFLTEVWVGIANFSNSSGPKETDNATLLDLIRKLRDMLITRRRNGQLSREEFQAVSMMSWFHLTLEFNSPIVEDLGATASSADERLVKIADVVGEPMGSKKDKLDSLFDLAEPMSSLLLKIEEDAFNDANVSVLYVPGIAGSLEQDMRAIIRAWSAATGDNIKGSALASRAVTPAPVPA